MTTLDRAFNGNGGDNLFNSDLSKWNVAKVTNLNGAFSSCPYFNADLSKVSN